MPVQYHYEIECIPGLVDVVHAELNAHYSEFTVLDKTDDALLIPFLDDPTSLLHLQSALAVYAVATYDIPRPKAWLGHENFHHLVDFIQSTQQIIGNDAFNSIYLSAAGSDSSVMTRLMRELSQHTHLKLADEAGDLLLRLRPSQRQNAGWDALVRLTPRPLSTRTWRVCNLPGALNAAVAHTMARWMALSLEDTVVNFGCGSGTLLIECLRHMPVHRAIGIDNAPQALECARKNSTAVEKAISEIEWVLGDIRQTSLPPNSVDALCADLPFGNLVGSHQQNVNLYPAMLKEAARIAHSGARLVIITHEVTLMDDMLIQFPEWRCLEQRMITLSGLHPRIYVLERT